MREYYRIMGLSPGATESEIRERYREMVNSCHPDKFPDEVQKSAAEEKIKELNEAYEVLRDHESRAVYDRQRKKASEKIVKHPAWMPNEPTYVSPSPSPVVPIEDLVPPPVVEWGAGDHLRYSFHASEGDQIEVCLDRQANVFLIDDLNYARYKGGGGFRYFGGYAFASPVVLTVPYFGNWHLVVDKGAYPGVVRAAARLICRVW